MGVKMPKREKIFSILLFIILTAVYAAVTIALILLLGTSDKMAITLMVSSAAAVYIIVIVVIFKQNIYILVRNSPEQREQVKVIGKRIKREYHVDTDDMRRTTYTYIGDHIIAFKLADGSVKEFVVDININPKATRAEPHIRTSLKGHEIDSCYKREIYESIHVSDTGILTYKERKNIQKKIKREEMRYEGRLFISFEKDSEQYNTD